MKISACNMLKGTVSSIQEGAVNGVVTIDLHDTKVKADITMEAIRDLGLKVGGQADLDREAPVKAEALNAAGLRVLLVEDNRLNMEISRDLLRRQLGACLNERT